MRGRFAPSPTGRMHLGNARTALLGWLQARAAGGAFLLRIEDLDPARSREALIDTLYRDLEFLGLTWDGEVWRQSQRSPVYDAALSELEAAGRVYPCFCSRAEIARAATAPHGAFDDGPRYPGTCAQLSAAQRAERSVHRTPAYRFRVDSGSVTFEDGVHGPVEQNVQATVGDFVIRRSDGVASYQLAVVVDDAASDITDVLRADDLLGSTPRQILLYRALGKPIPRFAHVSLVLGEDGKRLAKRDGSYGISSLRERNVSAEKILGLLAAWSGLGDGRPVSASELIDAFALKRLPREAVVAADREVAPLTT